MADNVVITAGTGTTVAADEVVDGTLGTVKAQYIKIMDGTLDGTAKAKVMTTAPGSSDPALVVALSPNGLNANGQTTMANSAPVVLASDQSVIPINGSIAHDAVDSGNPVKQGFKATTALSGLTLVADADRTNGFAGVDGVQIVRPHCNLEDIVSGNATNTDGTSTQCIAAQSAGIKTYLASIVLSNTGSNAITVDIKDGTTVKTSMPLPAGSGCIYNPPIPIPGTAATAWNFDASAAITGGTLTCSMLGFKSKI